MRFITGLVGVIAFGCGSVSSDKKQDAAVVIDEATTQMVTVMINRTGDGAGAITSSPSGIDCGAQCTGTFPVGTQLTLTPAAGADSSFSGWTGACSGLVACTLTLSADVTAGGRFAVAGELRLAAGIGSTGKDNIHGIAADAAGNIYVAGHYGAQLTYGGMTITNSGGQDAFVTKLAANGTPVWLKRFGGTSADQLIAMDLLPSGDVVIAGKFAGSVNFGDGVTRTAAGANDGFVVKLSGANGGTSWVRVFGASAGGAATTLGHDTAGHVIVAGNYSGTANFGGTTNHTAGGGGAPMAASYDGTSGSVRWAYAGTASSGANAFGVSMCVDIDSFYVGGAQVGQVQFTSAIARTAAGSDGFLAKHSLTNGALTWLTSLSGPGNDNFVQSAFKCSGGEIVIGASSSSATLDLGNQVTHTGLGGYDLLLVKYAAATGLAQSVRAYGGAGDTLVKAMAVDAAGEVTLGGDTNGTADFGAAGMHTSTNYDAFVLKLAADGTPRWSRKYASTANDRVRTMRIAPDGSILVGGRTGAADFVIGTQTLTNKGLEDAYLVHLGR